MIQQPPRTGPSSEKNAGKQSTSSDAGKLRDLERPAGSVTIAGKELRRGFENAVLGTVVPITQNK